MQIRSYCATNTICNIHFDPQITSESISKGLNFWGTPYMACIIHHTSTSPPPTTLSWEFYCYFFRQGGYSPMKAILISCTHDDYFTVQTLQKPFCCTSSCAIRRIINQQLGILMQAVALNGFLYATVPDSSSHFMVRSLVPRLLVSLLKPIRLFWLYKQFCNTQDQV